MSGASPGREGKGMPEGVESVLVVKPSSLGDIVHTLPSVHLLKRAHPALKIKWVVNTEWAPLLAENPDLDEVVLFPRKDFRFPPNLAKLRDWITVNRRLRPGLALDFQGLLRSALIGRLSGASHIHCLGDATISCRLLSQCVVPAIRSEEHAVTRYLKLVAPLGIDTAAPLEFPMPAGEKPAGIELPGRYLLVHPYSRGENKSIPDDCLARLVEMLAPVPVVLVGRTEEGRRPPEGCITLLNKTSLPGLIWLIRHAHFTVSVDSGPMHIAAAITGRLLGIHNWTDPFLVGPYNPDAWVWKNGNLLQMRGVSAPSGPGTRNFGAEDLPQVAEFLRKQF
ncbi:MAG TPA: glycosyltransferase family 9 protein [Chthoniobacteraceae bacterium]|nr:glycosyltransferase family 9 protein [Chthoniobacteraceae bacterium]